MVIDTILRNGGSQVKPMPKAQPKHMIDIVIAHHNEDVEWLMHVAPDIVLYAKGEVPGSAAEFRQVTKLPNIGRESHTFLYHIVTNYDTLANTTLFLQGSRDGATSTRSHTTLAAIEMRNKALAAHAGEVTTFGSEHERTWIPFEHWDGIDWQGDADCAFWLTQQNGDFLFADCTPAQFWKDLFGYDHPERIMFAPGALFAVQAETVRLRPRDFYSELLHKFVAANHINPEIGHFVERFWGEIFQDRRAK